MQWASRHRARPVRRPQDGLRQSGPRRRSGRTRSSATRIDKSYPGYLEQYDASAPGAKIYFTPQPLFFDVTTEWAATLQKMVAKEVPVDEGLDQLAASIDEQLQARPASAERRAPAACGLPGARAFRPDARQGRAHAARSTATAPTLCPRRPAPSGAVRLPYLLSLPALLVCIGILIPFVTAVWLFAAALQPRTCPMLRGFIWFEQLRQPASPTRRSGTRSGSRCSTRSLTVGVELLLGLGIALLLQRARPAQQHASRSCCCCR